MSSVQSASLHIFLSELDHTDYAAQVRRSDDPNERWKGALEPAILVRPQERELPQAAVLRGVTEKFGTALGELIVSSLCVPLGVINDVAHIYVRLPRMEFERRVPKEVRKKMLTLGSELFGEIVPLTGYRPGERIPLNVYAMAKSHRVALLQAWHQIQSMDMASAG